MIFLINHHRTLKLGAIGTLTIVFNMTLRIHLTFFSSMRCSFLKILILHNINLIIYIFSYFQYLIRFYHLRFYGFSVFKLYISFVFLRNLFFKKNT